jgi:hypothetical protein
MKISLMLLPNSRSPNLKKEKERTRNQRTKDLKEIPAGFKDRISSVDVAEANNDN